MRSADLLVCTGTGARDRLAAAAAPAVGQRQDSRRARRATSRPAASSRRSRCRRGSTAATATCTPQGNPHIQLDPRNIAKVAARWRARLAQIDAGERAGLPGAPRGLLRRAGARRSRKWEQQAAAAAGRGRRRAPQEHDLPRGAGSACARSATLEPKPGVEPSGGASERARGAAGARSRRRWWCARAYEDPRASQLARPSTPASRRSSLPFTVGGNDKATDLFGLFDSTRRAAAGRRRNEPGPPSTSRSCCRRSLAGAAGARDPRAARRAGAAQGHRLHRPRDRADRRRSASSLAGHVRARAERLAGAGSRPRPRRCSARCCSPGPSEAGPKCRKRRSASLFVLAATGGILLLANNPHGGEHLRDLLAGQILWVELRAAR